ncbi:hypothetical protein K7X08_038114 [Anisodus acutangulus]|uniref:Uncharacterized protein n=1 Tax=Anisodus acutangulus TaxID=402998 RepID=A0A9Q1N1L5_9SOLA|nr:hypothetical protein K7X08_038114 [Anisodus acutangulus]
MHIHKTTYSHCYPHGKRCPFHAEEKYNQAAPASSTDLASLSDLSNMGHLTPYWHPTHASVVTSVADKVCRALGLTRSHREPISLTTNFDVSPMDTNAISTTATKVVQCNRVPENPPNPSDMTSQVSSIGSPLISKSTSTLIECWLIKTDLVESPNSSHPTDSDNGEQPRPIQPETDLDPNLCDGATTTESYSIFIDGVSALRIIVESQPLHGQQPIEIMIQTHFIWRM